MDGSKKANVTFGGLLALLLAIRIYGITTDFWLDEIWVLNSLEQLQGFGEIFTRFRFPSNHLLNSFWMFAIYPQEGWMLYRLLSVISGCALLLLIWRQKNPRTRNFELLFVGGSYAMIILTSEARGYASLVFFSYAAWRCLPDLNRMSGKTVLLFALCCGLGVLSQATFVFFLGGIGALYLTQACLADARKEALMNAVRILFIPFSCFVAVYLLFYQHLEPIIPKEIPYLACLLTTIEHLFGQDQTAPFMRWNLLLIFVITNGVILWHLWKRDRPQAVFYLVTVWLLPIAVIVLKDPKYFQPRYFIVPLLFYLVHLARVFTETWDRRNRRILHVTLLVIYFAGQLPGILAFATHGRGGYSVIARSIADGTLRGSNYASNVDFINSMVLQYYLKREGVEETFRAAPLNQADTYFCLNTHLPGEDFHPVAPAGFRPLAVQTFPSAPFANYTVVIYSRLPLWPPGGLVPNGPTR